MADVVALSLLEGKLEQSVLEEDYDAPLPFEAIKGGVGGESKMEPYGGGQLQTHFKRIFSTYLSKQKYCFIISFFFSLSLSLFLVA